MKRPTHEVADELKLHPANLMLELRKHGVAFEDLWPEIDDVWKQTIQAMNRKEFHSTATTDPQAGYLEVGATEEASEVSWDAAKIVEKLWRKQKYGKHSVSVEGLRKLTHLSSDTTEAAVHELVRARVLLELHPHGPYSLDPAQTARIDKIAKLSMAHS